MLQPMGSQRSNTTQQVSSNNKECAKRAETSVQKVTRTRDCAVAETKGTEERGGSVRTSVVS